MDKQIKTLKIITGKELKNFLDKLNKQFGIKKIPGQIFMRGKERVFLFTGNFNEEELRNLEKASFIERIGTYIAKIENFGIRLSIEGSQIFKDQITKNFVELNEKEKETWSRNLWKIRQIIE